LLSLARELLYRDLEFVGVHAIDDAVALGVELLLDRAHGSAIDQRFRRGDAGWRSLREPQREFAGGGLQLRGRNHPGDQSPFIGLPRGKTVLAEEDLQRAPGADACDHADGAAAVRRDAELGVSRREA